MNNLSKLTFLFLLLMIIFPPNTILKAQVGIKSIGIDIGWYIPSMDFWNENTFIKNWSNQFEGGVYGRGFLEVKLVNNVSTRVGVGYWSQKQSQPNIIWGSETRTDELKLTLIPVTMDVIAYLDLEDLKPVSLYGGIGWGINFIMMEYTRTPSVSAITIDENNGQDYLGYLLGGINIPVTSGFATAIEFRYVFGEYSQQFYGTSNNTYYNDVSIAGPQITLALKYMLDE